jgi:hypothetical protein
MNKIELRERRIREEIGVLLKIYSRNLKYSRSLPQNEVFPIVPDIDEAVKRGSISKIDNRGK